MSVWIKCSDRLPSAKKNDNEVSDDLLAYVIGHGGYVRKVTVFYSFNDEEWMTDYGNPLESGERVTHWHEPPDDPAE